VGESPYYWDMIGGWKEGDIWGSGTCRSTTSAHVPIRFDMTDLGICVTKFDGNISFQLILESNGGNSRDGSDSRRFTVSDMTDCTYVDLSVRGDS